MHEQEDIQVSQLPILHVDSPEVVVPGTNRFRQWFNSITGGTTQTDTGIEVPKDQISIQKPPKILTSKEKISQEPVTPLRRLSSQEVAVAELDIREFMVSKIRQEFIKGKELSNQLEQTLEAFCALFAKEKRFFDNPDYQKYTEILKDARRLGFIDSNKKKKSPIHSIKSDIYSRRVYTKKYFDKYEDSIQEIKLTAPAILESVTSYLLSFANEPRITSQTVNKLIGIVNNVIDECRRYFVKDLLSPEMPALTETIIQLVKLPSLDDVNRGKLYDILQKVTVSPQQSNDLVMAMTEIGDLDHRLSYTLALTVGEHFPDSWWVQEQLRMRENLLHSLSGSPQDILDNYAELEYRSYDLVFSDSPIQMTKPGKAGLEIECEKNNLKHIFGELHQRWDLGYDMGINEIRNRTKLIKRNSDYRKSLINLSLWTAENTLWGRRHSLHFHFDDKEHPNMPHLGKLYHVKKDKRNYGTWEVRLSDPPLQGKFLNAVRLEDMILMFSYAADESSDILIKNKLSLPENASIHTILFGHICNYIHTPEGRLSALMAIRGRALDGFYPTAMLQTYQRRDWQRIATILSQQLQNKGDYQQLCHFVYLIGKDSSMYDWEKLDIFVSTEYVKLILNSLKNVPECRKLLLDIVKKNKYCSMLEKTKIIKEMLSTSIFTEEELWTLLKIDSMPLLRVVIEAFSRNIELYPNVISMLITANDVPKRRRIIEKIFKLSNVEECWRQLFKKEKTKTRKINATIKKAFGGQENTREGHSYYLVGITDDDIQVEYGNKLINSKGEVLAISRTENYKENEVLNEARNIFKNRFIGKDFYKHFQRELAAIQINVEFDFTHTTFNYTATELQSLKYTRGLSESIPANFCVLRPSSFSVQTDGVWIRKEMTLKNIVELFTLIEKALGQTLINKSTKEYVNEETKGNTSFSSGWAMPEMNILTASLLTTWSIQELYLDFNQNRRSSAEILFDTLMYYFRTGEKLLSTYYDTSATLQHRGQDTCAVIVGNFDKTGIKISEMSTESRSEDVGVCPTL